MYDQNGMVFLKGVYPLLIFIHHIKDGEKASNKCFQKQVIAYSLENGDA